MTGTFQLNQPTRHTLSLLTLLMLWIGVCLGACSSPSRSTVTAAPPTEAVAAASSAVTGSPDAAALIAGTREAIGRLTPANLTAEALTAAAVSPTPAVTATPTETPTPFAFGIFNTPTPVCPDAPPARLIVQERGRVLDDDPRALRMREDPGTTGKIIAQIPINTAFLVLKGPVCGDKYAWYYVRYRDQEGWIAEGDDQQYFVEPYLAG